MKSINKLLALSTMLISLVGCKVDDLNVITFKADDVISDYYGGVGVEWGTYEDTNKLVPDAKERIIKAVDYLEPSIVRCMFNYDWICGNLETYNNDDLEDDTWQYNFASQKMIDCCEVLDYCQDHNIDVAFGGWNVIGNADASVDVWGMIPNSTSDIRWAKMSTDIVSYLVNEKGYSCIKWFVNTNEPNWTGTVGQSKMAYNTYEKWETGVRNVRRLFDEAGLQQIDIVGGDVTGFGKVALEYMDNISKNLKDVVNNYGAHYYIGNLDIAQNKFYDYLSQLYAGMKENDPNIDNKNFYIWEAGLLDGKNVETDCQQYIQNYPYGYRMADYTVQSVLAGLDGVCYWDLDDAMHFMYTNGTMTPKEWGMFSTLASAPLRDQEYRPWYYSSVMLSRALRKGAKIYRADTESELNMIGTTDKDEQNGYICLVNHNNRNISTTVRLEKEVANNQTSYVYIYKDGYLRLDRNGHIVPNMTFEKGINNAFTIEVPTSSLVLITSELI